MLGTQRWINTNLPSNCSQCRNAVIRNSFSFFLILTFITSIMVVEVSEHFFAFIYFHLCALKRDHADRVAVMFISFILKHREFGWLLKCCGENIPSVLSSYFQQWSPTFPVLTLRCFHGKSILIWHLKISYGKTLILSHSVYPNPVWIYIAVEKTGHKVSVPSLATLVANFWLTSWFGNQVLF